MIPSRRVTAALLAAIVLAAGCGRQAAGNAGNDLLLGSRLEPLFKKAKPVCFGRFVIDVPETATVVWGETLIPAITYVHRDEGKDLHDRVATREAKLKAEPRFPADEDLSLYFETLDGAAPGQKVVVSQRSFTSKGMLQIDSYQALGSDLVQFKAYTLEGTRDGKAEVIAELNDIARRLRPRVDNEVPTEAGQCLDRAFLPDKANAAFEHEEVQVGIRLKEFPDVHLSIRTVSKDMIVESDALEPRVERAATEAGHGGLGWLHSQVKFFRKGERTISGTTGYEVLARLPAVGKGLQHHDMRFGSVAVPKDPLKPLFDIALETGVKANAAGAVAPSLSDDEALALWEQLTRSIRPRLTTAAGLDNQRR